jgi:hypothetical protein
MMITNDPTGQPVQWVRQPKTSGLAVTALVTGIVGLCLSWVAVLDLVLPIVAIVFGAVGMSQTRTKGMAGRGMAIAGLVMGIITVAVFGVILAVAASS